MATPVSSMEEQLNRWRLKNGLEPVKMDASAITADNSAPRILSGKLPKHARTHYYVYALVDPRYKDEIKYVGLTTNPQRRLTQHIRKPVSSRMREWLFWLKLCRVKPEMVIIDEFDFHTVGEALEKETEYIEAYSDQPLLNIWKDTVEQRRYYAS